LLQDPERQLNNPGTSALKPRTKGCIIGSSDQLDLIPSPRLFASPALQSTRQTGGFVVSTLLVRRLAQSPLVLSLPERRIVEFPAGAGWIRLACVFGKLHGIGGDHTSPFGASSSAADGKRCHGCGVEILLWLVLE